MDTADAFDAVPVKFSSSKTRASFDDELYFYYALPDTLNYRLKVRSALALVTVKGAVAEAASKVNLIVDVAENLEKGD